MIRGKAIASLGDYFMYFHQEPLMVSREQTPANSAYSRYYSFQSYLLRLREDLGKCHKRMGFTAPQCQDEIHAPERIVPLLTDEEMFVLMARGSLDHWSDDPDYNGSEFLTVPFADPAFIARGERSLKFACQKLRAMLPEAIGARGEGMIRKSVAYCDGLANHQ